MRLVFLGTPDFAVPCLDALVGSDHETLLVVSQMDKVRRRGKAAEPTPVRSRAIDLGLPNLCLERGGRRELYQRVLELEPEIAVVVAFGHIIREPLLDGPLHGCLNVHASVLPRWRGPAPIHRAIVAGDTESGVTTMKLEAGVDTGPTYLTATTPIGADETAGELHDRLAEMGSRLLIQTLDGLARGELSATAQPDQGVCHAPLLSKHEGSVDFDQSARRVHDRIRGLNPWPGITVSCGEGSLKLAASRYLGGAVTDAAPGTIVSIEEAGMRVACADGLVLIGRVQAPGSRWSSPSEFRRGHSLEPGQSLTPLAGKAGR